MIVWYSSLKSTYPPKAASSPRLSTSPNWSAVENNILNESNGCGVNKLLAGLTEPASHQGYEALLNEGQK